MTVNRDDTSHGDVLAGFARLGLYDVSQRRSRQLRRRCHGMLQSQPSKERLSGIAHTAWCFAYLVEIVRCTVAIYGNLGAPITARGREVVAW
jgi:hypothetical protein